MVVYTGEETKVMKNSASGIKKLSSNDKLMGRQIIVIVIVELLLCLFAALWYTIGTD